MESERDPVQGETPEERAQSAREHAEGHRSEAPSSQAEIGAELNEYQADVSERAADAQEAAASEESAREHRRGHRTTMDDELDPPEDPLLRQKRARPLPRLGPSADRPPITRSTRSNVRWRRAGKGWPRALRSRSAS